MLAASVAGALLRAGATRATLATALLVTAAVVLGGAATYPFVRRSVALQLVSAAVLAFAGAPIEAAGLVSTPLVVRAALTRTAVFVASVLLARAALAAAGRNGARRSAAFELAAGALSLTAALGFGAAGHFPEAVGCWVAAGSTVPWACCRPTAKDLKPVGLWLSALVVLSAVLPVLS